MPTIDDYLQDLATPGRAPSPHDSCPVCLQPYTDPVELPCQGQHVFCRGCVQEWLESANNCPLCREVLVEYDDDDSDDDEATRAGGRGASSTTQQQLSRMISEHITPISLKIAFCRGVHSVTARNSLAAGLQVALNRIRDKIDPSSVTNITSVMGYINGLREVDAEVDVAISLVEEAPVHHWCYRRIRQDLSEVKDMILAASEAVD